MQTQRTGFDFLFAVLKSDSITPEGLSRNVEFFPWSGRIAIPKIHNQNKSNQKRIQGCMSVIDAPEDRHEAVRREPGKI